MTWVLDLDGVVWLAGKALPGAADAVERLRAKGERVLFLTNNAGPTLAEHAAKLRHVGIQAERDDIISSAQAGASLLAEGTKTLVIGGEGLYEALGDRKVKIVTDWQQAEAVVVGRTEKFGYRDLEAATLAIRNGARFIGTNDDSTYPTPQGLVPGAGAIIAAVSTAAGQEPEIAGKPCQPVADLVRQRVGQVSTCVGDRPDTDGLMARRLKARFVLVLTGVTTRADLPVDPEPDEIVDDLAAAVQ